MSKASLKNYRQSPRKVRLVADVVRGKSVSDALTVLSHMRKRAAEPVKKVIESAAANAKEKDGAQGQDLIVQKVAVDKGHVFKRFMPRARGRASMIRKRTSHIAVSLEEKQNAKVKDQS